MKRPVKNTKLHLTRKRVSCSQLKSDLAQLLSAVRAGTYLVITENDKPVAKLTPIERKPIPQKMPKNHVGPWASDDSFEPEELVNTK